MTLSSGQKLLIAIIVLSALAFIPIVGWLAILVLIPVSLAWYWKVSAAAK